MTRLSGRVRRLERQAPAPACSCCDLRRRLEEMSREELEAFLREKLELLRRLGWLDAQEEGSETVPNR